MGAAARADEDAAELAAVVLRVALLGVAQWLLNVSHAADGRVEVVVRVPKDVHVRPEAPDALAEARGARPPAPAAGPVAAALHARVTTAVALAAHVQLPINMVLKIDAMTFTRRTSPQSDVAYIYPVAVKAPLIFETLTKIKILFIKREI